MKAFFHDFGPPPPLSALCADFKSYQYYPYISARICFHPLSHSYGWLSIMFRIIYIYIWVHGYLAGHTYISASTPTWHKPNHDVFRPLHDAAIQGSFSEDPLEDLNTKSSNGIIDQYKFRNRDVTSVTINKLRLDK